jgi:hypothetical protein
VSARGRKALIRLAVSWGLLLLAILVGFATHSVGVFVALVALGLVVSVIFRFTILR